MPWSERSEGAVVEQAFAPFAVMFAQNVGESVAEWGEVS